MIGGSFIQAEDKGSIAFDTAIAVIVTALPAYVGIDRMYTPVCDFTHKYLHKYVPADEEEYAAFAQGLSYY